MLTFLSMGGCAPVISKKVLDKVDRTIGFSEIQKNPDSYRGKRVLLGGTIVAVENLEDKTLVEVLQQPLNSALRPVRPEESKGRFLVLYRGFKDPALYAPGRALTVAGIVEGERAGKIDKMPYTYPLILAEEDHLWSAYRGPGVSLGIGIYGSFD